MGAFQGRPFKLDKAVLAALLEGRSYDILYDPGYPRKERIVLSPLEGRKGAESPKQRLLENVLDLYGVPELPTESGLDQPRKAWLVSPG